MDDNALHELSAVYALDALEAADVDEYEEHLAHCPRCQAELAAHAAAAGALAFGVEPAEPPAALRERILGVARSERSNVVPFPARYGFYRRNAPRMLALAASVAAIGLGVWNVVLHERLDRSHEALRSVLLHGAAGSVVLGPEGQGTMTVAALKPAPAGKTYEAWVILDGKAQPAGTFIASGKTVVVHLRRPVPRGAIVAVTIETEGGSQQPTTQPFITSSQA